MTTFTEIGSVLDSKRAFELYLPANLSLYRFEEGLQDTCKKVLEGRKSLIEAIFGKDIEFEVQSSFAAPDEKDPDLWAWIGMEAKAGKVGSIYAGYFWDGRGGRNEVQAFASLAFSRKSEYVRAKGLLREEIHRGDLVGDDKWWELYHYIALSSNDLENYGRPFEVALETWIGILNKASFREKFFGQ